MRMKRWNNDRISFLSSHKLYTFHVNGLIKGRTKVVESTNGTVTARYTAVEGSPSFTADDDMGAAFIIWYASWENKSFLSFAKSSRKVKNGLPRISIVHQVFLRYSVINILLALGISSSKNKMIDGLKRSFQKLLHN